MSSEFKSVASLALPPESGIIHTYESANLSDAFSIRLPASASSDPELLARFVLAHQPTWIAWLTKVRDMMVAGFGIKTAKHLATLARDGKTDRIGIFNVYGRNETEIVVGEDDKHLDFRVSVLCLSDATAERNRYLVVSTVVCCHNRMGRAYLFVIAPFHRMVVKSSLLRAARMGWPPSAGT